MESSGEKTKKALDFVKLKNLILDFIAKDNCDQMKALLSSSSEIAGEGGGLSADDFCSVIHELDTTTEGRSTPFSLLCESESFQMVSLIVEYLVKNDRHETLNTVRVKEGVTVLYCAADEGRLKNVELLLEAGADPGLESAPLHPACLKGHAAVASLLLKGGANIDKADSDGTTPLIWACSNGHLAVVSLLLEGGANAEKADSYGITPLIWACFIGHLDVVKVLLANGANINLPILPPIYYAACTGHESIVSTLLAYNADTREFSEFTSHSEALAFVPKPCTDLIRSWPSLRNQIAVKLCVDRLKKQGYYEVVKATMNNDLPQWLFAFKVIEMMKMCGMEPLAELLIGFVVTNIGSKL